MNENVRTPNASGTLATGSSHSVPKAKPAAEAKPRRPKGWLGRSITNYKKTHAKLAEERGVSVAFAAATTLTAAKKILFGK